MSGLPPNHGDAVEPELAEPFELASPASPACSLVFSSPHSGNVYPLRFLEQTRLDSTSLRRSEDAHVDVLFACAQAIGAPLLRAKFPRAYLDLNREPYELDPRMFEDSLPEFANTRSLRVAAGLGTIPRSLRMRARYTPASSPSRRRFAGSRRFTNPITPRSLRSWRARARNLDLRC